MANEEFRDGNGMPMDIKNWIRSSRGKQDKDTYVDSAEVPAEPEGPYRARAVTAPHEHTPPGFEVRERQVVNGELQMRYEVRCPCGHLWSSMQFQRMSVCPRCDRAVLVAVPPPHQG